MKNIAIVGSDSYTQRLEACDFYYGRRPFGRNASIPARIESHQKACHNGQFIGACRGCQNLKKQQENL